MFRAAAVAVALSVVPASLASADPPAFAPPNVNDLDAKITAFSAGMLDRNGDEITQAGEHPYVVENDITFALDASGAAAGSLKEVVVDMPVGFSGDQTEIPTCTVDQLAALDCPAGSQIGTFDLYTDNNPTPASNGVWNMEVPKGQPARFGTDVISGSALVFFDVYVRPGDHGLRVVSRDVSTLLSVSRTVMKLWGIPADPSHDPERHQGHKPPQPAGVAPVPFLTAPTRCDAPPVTTVRTSSWLHPARFHDATFTGAPLGGCDRLQFEPDVRASPVHAAASAPTGLTVELTQKLNDTPASLATAQLEDAAVTLPEGMRINPGAADGLAVCSEAQIGLGNGDPAHCPQASKVGEVTIDTPALAEPLRGAVYQAAQNANPFGSTLALYLAPESARYGVRIKLAGEVTADPATGQLTTTFRDNPQLPFSKLTLQLKGGPHALLTAPDTCGTFTTSAVLTSWSGKTVRTASPMTIDQGCDGVGRFEPSLSAGTTNPVAGASAPFVMSFARPDGQAELGAVNGSLPPGLLGVLASVPLCSAAQGAAGTCPAASRVGHAQVAVGAGSSPLWVPAAGRPENAVYLTEPFRKGDVAGMSIVTRAVAGPFDLGTVVTKVYLKLRDKDQGIDLQSDRLPRILDGIPLQIRRVVVTIDRKDFMVNPTSCAAMATYANVFSQSWAKVPVTSRFQVGGCASLAFSPIITARAGGKGDVRRYEHPALSVTVRQAADQAHLSKANVVLPKALNIDLNAPALKAACPRDAYAQDKCSPVATVGTARAVTPLLREPLVGPAFLIQKKGKLPDLVMRLRNNRMSLDLIGVLDFLKDGRLITRVKGIPDAALSSFVLQIKGGKGGSLLNRGSLCARHRLVKTTFQGQNGKRSYKTPLLHIAGCAKAKAKTKAKARRASHAAARRASARASAAGGARAAARATTAAVPSGGDQRAAGGRS